MNGSQVEISRKIVTYFDGSVIGELSDSGSYRSWEHCFSFFQGRNTFDPDTAALHLGFYLASWGMYRGSAAIRKYDYKVHLSAVDAIRHSRIQDFFEIDGYSDEKVDNVFALYNQLCVCYGDKVGALETLVTKILLGTLGCSPAYDRFLKDGLARLELPRSFSKSGLNSIVKFCKDNRGVADAQSKLQARGYNYPAMRVFDIYCHSLARH